MRAAAHNDNALFTLICAGNEKAFTELFYKYSDHLFTYCLKILHSRYWAEEAVQNVFMQIWQHRQMLDSVENAQSYLYRMATNRSIDILRANEKQIKIEYTENILTQVTSAEDTIHLKESELILNAAVQLLPEKRKLIYQLRNTEGLSYEEISEQLQVSRHTVRNQLAKAVETIRNYLVSHGVTIVFLVINFWLE